MRAGVNVQNHMSAYNQFKALIDPNEAVVLVIIMFCDNSLARKLLQLDRIGAG